MKKGLIGLVIIIIIVLISYFVITNMSKDKKKEENSNVTSNSNVTENSKDTISIDYKMYQELRSAVYEKETFAILIMNSSENDDVSKTFRREILYSFKDKKAKIYQLDISKLSQAEYSGVIDDVTKIKNYDKPTIVIPTLLLSKTGSIVYVQEGLAYSNEIIPNLEKNNIE